MEFLLYGLLKLIYFSFINSCVIILPIGPLVYRFYSQTKKEKFLSFPG